MSDATQADRPAPLDTLSTTQLDELDRQFDDGDRAGWDRLRQEYGWTAADGAAVWNWFGQRQRSAGT